MANKKQRKFKVGDTVKPCEPRDWYQGNEAGVVVRDDGMYFYVKWGKYNQTSLYFRNEIELVYKANEQLLFNFMLS